MPGVLTARQLVRYVARLHGATTRPPSTARWRPSACWTSPTVGSTASARACASGRRSPPPSSRRRHPRPRRAAERCRPGAARPPHRPLPATGQRGPDGHRQLPRAARGGAPGRARDRPAARPAGGRGRPPRHPRRDGRPAPQVLVRTAASRPLAAALLELDGSAASASTATTWWSRRPARSRCGGRAAPPGPLGRRPAGGGPSPRRLAREHVPGAGAMTAAMVRPRLHAAGSSLPLRRLPWLLALPASGRCCSACWPGSPTARPTAPSPRSPPTACSPCSSRSPAGDRRRRPRRRGPGRHVPLHVAVPDAGAHHRGRALARRRLVALVTLGPRSRFGRGGREPAVGVAHGRRHAAAAAAYLGVFVLVGGVRGGRGLVVGLRVPDRAAAGRGPVGHRAAVPDVGGPGGLRRLAPGAQDLERKGVPDGWAGVVRLAIITLVTLALASCAFATSA